MNLFARIIATSLLVLLLTVAMSSAATMSDYSATPPVIADSSEPNVLILLSNDWTGFTQGYVNEPSYNNGKEYWGYFDSRYYYEYSSGGGGYFSPVGLAPSHYHPGGDFWSGNFLNWVTMSNADFLRKALTGGRRNVDSITSSRLERGAILSRPWDSKYTGADLNRLVPTGTYDDPTYQFHNSGITMEVQNSSGNAVSSQSTFTVVVEACVDDPGNNLVPDSTQCTYYPQTGNYKPQGLLQLYGTKIRFGLMSYSHAKPREGGVLRRNIGSILDEYNWDTNGQEAQFKGTIKYVNEYSEKGWDPLAEMFYEAVRYFKGNAGAQEAYCGSGNFRADDGHTVYGCEGNLAWEDPILDFCQGNHIIILNDEYPSQEHDSLPGSTINPGYTLTEAFAGANDKPYTPDVGALTSAVGAHEGINGGTWKVGRVVGGDTSGNCTAKSVPDLADAYGICPTESGGTGTFYLAGLANDAFTTDMRPTDFEETQNVTTWAIAYRATSAQQYFEPIPPMNQMWLAAKYGNFEDINGNKMPDAGEWEDTERLDSNGDPYPVGYFPAENGDELYEALNNVFLSILETTASGTSVSVLSNSGQGEGNLVQAYYRPRISDGSKAVEWLGFLQSLWIDSYGFIREDTNGNARLDENADYVVRYVEDGSDTLARVYPVSDTNPHPDLENDPYIDKPLDQVKTLWESGKQLSVTSPADRNIFTFVDIDNDGMVDDSGTVPWDLSEEVFRFTDRTYRFVMPYLNVNETTDGYLGRSQKIRSLNLVRWTEGYDPEVNSNRFVDLANTDMRTRSLDGSAVYKLGDIINSTPVTLSKPVDNFHIIYSDSSYQDFYDTYENRETVSYVGSNDGMLHAFTSHVFDQATASFSPPASAPATEKMGTELWAYIPSNLLPHLKWLPRQDYSHVYYVDMQPRIFDARIFFKTDGFGNQVVDDNTKHPNGWGTVLIGGFNIGGGRIEVTDYFHDGSNYNYGSKTFKPSFFAIDITDPRNPQLLWEKTFENLGMSSVYPAVMRLGPNATSPGTDFADDPGAWYVVLGSGPDAGGRGTSTLPQYGGHSTVPGYVYMVDVRTGEPVKSGAAPGNDWLFETADNNAFIGPPVSFDKNLNYNTDAAYIPITYDANGNFGNHDWKGAIYKVTVPWTGLPPTGAEAKSNYGNIVAAPYSDNPLGTTNMFGVTTGAWQFHKMFDSPRPITAAPALSIDHLNNTWVYFGTGRMFDGADDPNADFGSTETEYLFGIKDPFFGVYYDPGVPGYVSSAYYLDYSQSRTVAAGGTVAALQTDLFEADPFIILETGIVYKDTGGLPVYYGYFDEMVKEAQEYDGWYRTLPTVTDAGGKTRAMRNLNKPAVIGGLSLFTTFIPTGDACSFGGSSNLAILYYETGTAFKRAVVRGDAGYRELNVDLDGDGTNDREIADGISLGSGTTSSVGIHIGRQNDRFNDGGDNPEGDMITGFVQQGTGKVVEIDIETAVKIRSGLRAWRERQ